MNSSDWNKDEILLAKQISGGILLTVVLLGVVLSGILFGWAALVLGLIMLLLFAFWLLRLMIRNAEEKIKSEHSDQ